MLKDRYSGLSRIERRIFWIVLTLALVTGAFAITLLDTFLGAPNLQTRLANAVPFVLSIFSLVSAGLILFGKNEQASWVLVAGAFITLVTAVTQAEGYGFPAAFVLLAITLFVPLQLLTGRKALTALVIGIIGTITIILLDTFWILPRVAAVTQDVNGARVASVILGLIIFVAVALQFRDFSIRSKLLLLAVGTGLISIVLVASSISYFTQQALRTNVKNSLISAAAHSVEQIDTFINTSTYQITADAQIPDVIAYLKASPKEQEPLREEVVALLNSLSQSDPINISSYAILDKNGIDIVDTFKQDIGIDKSDRDYFIIPMTKGQIYISPVRYSPTSDENAFYIGTPVFDENGNIIGVLRIRYRSSILQQVLKSNNEFAGEKSYGLLVDEYGVVLANGVNPDWISRTLSLLEPNTYAQLQTENRLPNMPIEELSLNLTTFSDNLQQDALADGAFFPSSETAWGIPVEVGVANSTVMPWKVAYVQPQSITRQVINQQKQIVVLAGLLTGFLVAIAGFVVANTITRPILGLASTAEQIASGDISARASVNTNDEIKTLATSFNLMTDRIKETLGSLERRVAERTADLETARLLSERRAEELQSISEISRIISSEQRLDTLLSLITRLVSEKFDFYHTGIFLIEETRQFAVLQAANSEGGQRMLARGHRLEVGHTGLVGNVAQTGISRIALDVGSDAVYFDNPDLPKTRSEMALPLNLRGATIGVLDVQSTKPGAFTENDAKTLSILADQIAIAIDNARLFGQNRQALDEVQSLYNQYLRQEWSTFGRQGTQIGYFQSLVGGRPLSKPVDSEEIQAALQKGTVVVVDGKDEKAMPTIAVPVRLRGQTIGVLNIKAPTKHRRWTQDEVNLAQAVSDRLALALDNARLLFESQRQTAKEQKIGEVTAKIGASINMQNVLQTAVEELGRALPGSEVVIQFTSSSQES